MSSIFQIAYNTLVQQLLPPLLRQPKQIAWLTSQTTPLQINNDLFVEFISGSTSYPQFNASSAYTATTRVIYSDDAVYEALSATTSGITPANTSYWIQVNSSYIGAIERSKYSAIKLVYELALNRFFQVSGVTSNFTPVAPNQITEALFAASANTIYIQNNVVTNSQMLMDNSGAFGSYMAKNSLYSQTFMGNSYSGISNNDYTIYVPNGLGLTTDQVRNFADTINAAGFQYTVSFY